MANFLINCSNIKNGGALQVADSVCRQLHRFPNHTFYVVLSSQLEGTKNELAFSPNVTCLTYDIKDDWRSLLFGRNTFLDNLVAHNHIEAVLSVFGPSRWRPRVSHLCGFARAQLIKDVNSIINYKIGQRLTHIIWRWGFRRSSNTFYTENSYISDKLPQIVKNAKVYTVSNYYNQVFDQPGRWTRSVQLSAFSGVTMLTVSSTASHKNLRIMVPVSEYLERHYPDFQFRFVLTCKHAPFDLSERLARHFVFIGKVDVAECPNLYEQADIMFMPSLLECFTATYPEAMRMNVPIVTTDLEFAHGLCGDAACYYSALDAKAAAEAIYSVATSESYRLQLVANGREQLKKFDDYEQRAEKLIKILESMVKN